MKMFTQSSISPGNCWQTAVACILEVQPELLPPQEELHALPNDVLEGHGYYANVLNGYLRKHHNLGYVTIHGYQTPAIRALKHYWHVISGPTVRTAEHGLNHAVVGCNGMPVWDPHPSRSFLIMDDVTQLSWGVLVPARPLDEERMANNRGYRMVYGCLCPACGNLKELRRSLSCGSPS
jgi:hypothetical protein